MAVNATQQRAEALLYWVNTFPLDSPVTTLQELNDGQALAKVLEDIDPSFHATDLRNTSNPSNWVPRWENLKLVNKALSRYTREECYEASGLALSQNLKRIAEDADVQGLIELLSVFLLASALGPKTATYVPRIQGSEHAATLANIIKEKQEEDAAAAAGLPVEPTLPVDPTSGVVDIDLALEEKYGELLAKNETLELQNKRIKVQNADLLTRLDKLEESHEDLKTRHLAAEDKCAELSNRLDVSSPEVIKHLEEKVREQDVLISIQEKQIEDDGNTKSTLQRELNTLRNAASENKEFKIQVEEQKHEIEELSKKSNALERYKQKLESQKHLEPENSRLKQEVAELSQESAKLQKRVEQFETAHSKYQTTIQNSELELFEIRNQKSTIEFENRQLQQQVSNLKEREEHDSARIIELQERVAGTGVSSTLDSPVKSTGMNLQAEIEGVEPSGPDLELEVTRLRHTVELLQGGANAAQERFDLELAVTDANRIRDTAEKKYQTVFEEHVLLQKQLSEIFEGRTKEGYVSTIAKDMDNALKAGPLTWLTYEFYSNELDKTYKDMSTRLAKEVQEAKKKIERLEIELGDKSRELLAVQADLSMVDNDELEQIEILKSSNATIIPNLESNYNILKTRYQTLQDESEIHRNHLTEALLSKDRIRNERDELTTRVSQLQASQNEDKEQQIKTQSSKIKELQDRLKNAAEGKGHDKIKTEKDEIIMNLKREIALMTTAWYDLTTRIQSNNVVLQRRSDAPKSWINKQRQAALGGVPRR